MTYSIVERRSSTVLLFVACVFAQNGVYAQSGSSPSRGVSVGPTLNAESANDNLGSKRNIKKTQMLRHLQVMQGRLRNVVNRSDDDIERQQVTDEIKSSLAKYFDSDMVLRRAEVQRVKKRVEQTQTHLSNRASAKQDLVDLQVESFKYETDGLELFGVKQRKQRSGVNISVGHVAYAITGMSTTTGSGAMSEAHIRVDDAREMLKQAKSADSKEVERQALEDLNAALIDYFDSDMKFRAKEIAEIRIALRKMEALLEKRSKSKQAIIDLQLRMIVNEAKGLGFFNSSVSMSADGSYHSGPKSMLNAYRSGMDAYANGLIAYQRQIEEQQRRLRKRVDELKRLSGDSKKILLVNTIKWSTALSDHLSSR